MVGNLAKMLEITITLHSTRVSPPRGVDEPVYQESRVPLGGFNLLMSLEREIIMLALDYYAEALAKRMKEGPPLPAGYYKPTLQVQRTALEIRNTYAGGGHIE